MVSIFPRVWLGVQTCISPWLRRVIVLRGGPGAHACPTLALFHAISRSARNCRCGKSHGVTNLLSYQRHLHTCRRADVGPHLSASAASVQE